MAQEEWQAIMAELLTAEQIYNAYRASHKEVIKKRGGYFEPRWKDLKPWVKRVWYKIAMELNNGT